MLHAANHFYLPTNAPNCIKFKRLKSACINILKDNPLAPEFYI